jgi:hypothetical protein
MLLVYLTLLVLLGVVRFLVARRAARLEKKYARFALAAQEAAQQTNYKPGNNKPDPYKTAKAQYELGHLVQKRDRYEAAHASWKGLADRLGRVSAGMGRWQGRWVPYLLGGVDAVLILATVTYLGLVDPNQVRQWIEAVVSR